MHPRAASQIAVRIAAALVFFSNATALAQTPPPPLPAGAKVGKARSSANGLYAIRVVEEAKGKCKVQALKGNDLSWSLDACVANVDDAVFINNDATRFWVLHTLPEIPTVSKREKKSRRIPQQRAVVAQLFSSDGAVLKQRTLSDYVPPYRMGLVRSLNKHFKWLEGIYEVPGKAPRLTDDQKIQFETVTSKTHTLEF